MLASASCLDNVFRSHSIQSGVLTPHGSIDGLIVGEPLLVTHRSLDPVTGPLSFATGLEPRNDGHLLSLMILAQSASSTSRRGTQSSSLYRSSSVSGRIVCTANKHCCRFNFPCSERTRLSCSLQRGFTTGRLVPGIFSVGWPSGLCSSHLAPGSFFANGQTIRWQ